MSLYNGPKIFVEGISFGKPSLKPRQGYSLVLTLITAELLAPRSLVAVMTNVFFHVLPATDRFKVLASGLVDFLSRTTTQTYERDAPEPRTSMTGFTFSQPNFYDKLSFLHLAIVQTDWTHWQW